MDKHGTAPPSNPRPGVVIKLNDQIIKVIRTPKAVAMFLGASFDRTIIPPIRRIFDPSIIWFNALGWQQCPRVRQAVGPPPQANQAERAARSSAVALAFVGCNAGAT
jgi:hypothetical protein